MPTIEKWKTVLWTCFCLAFLRSLSAAVSFANLEKVQLKDYYDVDHLELVKTNGSSDSSISRARKINELNTGENFHSFKTFDNGDAQKKISPNKNRLVPTVPNANEQRTWTSFVPQKQNTAPSFVIAVRKRREANRATKTLDSEPYFLNDEGSDFIPYAVNKEDQKSSDETPSRRDSFVDLSDTKSSKRKQKSSRQAVAFIVTPESFASLLKNGISKNAFKTKNIRDDFLSENQPTNKKGSFVKNSSQDLKKRKNFDVTQEWDDIFSDIPNNNEDKGYIGGEFSSDTRGRDSNDKVEEFKNRESSSTKYAPLFREEKSDRFKKQFSSSFDSILLNAKMKKPKENRKADNSFQGNLKKSLTSSGLRTKGETDAEGKKISNLIKSLDWDLSENKPIDKRTKDDRVNIVGSKYESSGNFDSTESSKKFDEFDKIRKGNFNYGSLKGNDVSPLTLTKAAESDELFDLLTLLDHPANFKKEKKVNTNSHGKVGLPFQQENIRDNTKTNKKSMLNLKNSSDDEDKIYHNKKVNRDQGSSKTKLNRKTGNEKRDDIRKEINYFSEDEPLNEHSSKEQYFKNENVKSRLRDKSDTKIPDDCDRIPCTNSDLTKKEYSNSSYPDKYKSIVEKLNKSPNLISKFDFQLLNKSEQHKNNENKSDIKLFENLLQLHELTRVKAKNKTEKVSSLKETSLEKISSNALRENKEKTKTISKDRSNKGAITLAELINSYHDKGEEKNRGSNITLKIPSRIDYGNVTSIAPLTARPKSFHDVTEGIKNLSKSFSITPTKVPSFSKIEANKSFRAETSPFSLPASKSISSETLPAVPLSISSLTPGGSPVFINSHVFVSSTPFPELLSQLDYVPRIRTPSTLSPNENLQSPGVYYNIFPGILKGNHALRGLLEGDPITSNLLSGLNTVSNKGLIGISDPLQRLRKNNSLDSFDGTTPSSFTRQTSAFSNSSPFPTTPAISNTPLLTSPFSKTLIPTTPYPITSYPTTSFPTSPGSTFSHNQISPISIVSQHPLLAATLSSAAPSPTKPHFITHQSTTPFATSQHPSTPFPNFSRTLPSFPATTPFKVQQNSPVTPFPSLRPSSNLISNTPHPVTTLIPFSTLHNSRSMFPPSVALSTRYAGNSPFYHPQNSLVAVSKNLSPLNFSPNIQLSVNPFAEAYSTSPLLRSNEALSTPSSTTNLSKQLTPAPLAPSGQAQRQTNSRRLRARIRGKERTPSLAPLINSKTEAQISIDPLTVTVPGNLKKTRKKIRRKGRRPLLGSQNSTEIASQVSLAISPIPKIMNALQDTLVSNTESGSLQNPAGSVTKQIEFKNKVLASEKLTSTDLNTKKITKFSSSSGAQKLRKRRPISKLRGKATNHAPTSAVPNIATPSSLTNSFPSTFQKTSAPIAEGHISLVSSTNNSTFSKPNSLTKTYLPQIIEPAIKKISAVPRVKNPTSPSSHRAFGNFTPDNRKLKPLHGLTSVTPLVKHSNTQHFQSSPQPLHLNRLVLSNENYDYPSNFPIPGSVNNGFLSDVGIGHPVSSHNFAVPNGLAVIPRNSFESSFNFNPNNMQENPITSVRNVQGQLGIPYFENTLPDLPRHQARTNTPSIEQGSYFIPSIGSLNLISERYPIPIDFHSGPTIGSHSRSVGLGSPLITRGPPSLRKYYLQDV